MPIRYSLVRRQSVGERRTESRKGQHLLKSRLRRGSRRTTLKPARLTWLPKFSRSQLVTVELPPTKRKSARTSAVALPLRKRVAILGRSANGRTFP